MFRIVALSRGWFEAVANISDRLDQRRIVGLGLDLFSQCCDTTVNAARVHVDAGTPY